MIIYRPGIKMEEEESQGWLSWMWNWGGEPETQTKEVKTGGRMLKYLKTARRVRVGPKQRTPVYFCSL